MNVVERAIGDIAAYPKNAKKHPEAQVKQIADSITEFGFNQPIVVDKDGVIIVGHGRYAAAQFLGLENVPVIEVDISEEKAKAYRLADNKLNESDWDMGLVLEELRELSVAMVDLTGFSRDLILGNAEKENAAPDLPAVPKSREGDLYELGAHRVLCGDATKQEDFARLMDGKKADMLLTDPPYNVNYTGKTKDALKIDNDNKSASGYLDFLVSTFSHVDAYTKRGGALYVWHADMQSHIVIEAFVAAKWHWAQKLIWSKNAMVLGRQDYQWKHEPCLYGWKEGATHLWNADRSQTTILSFDRPSRSESHPTMKPVELLSYQINNNTKGEDIVLDPFLGSGSTLIASEKMGRICFGLELDPKYVDVIVQRYVDYSGNKTVKKNGEEIVW